MAVPSRIMCHICTIHRGLERTSRAPCEKLGAEFRNRLDPVQRKAFQGTGERPSSAPSDVTRRRWHTRCTL